MSTCTIHHVFGSVNNSIFYFSNIKVAFITEQKKSFKASFSVRKKENNSFSWTVLFIVNHNNTSQFFFVLCSLRTNTYVDYDWILMDITSFGTDQASRIASACPQINSGTLPWVRCNISDVILFGACATSQYQTGMCPSSTATTTTAFGPSFCSSLSVTAGQKFLLQPSNWTQNQHGYSRF